MQLHQLSKSESSKTKKRVGRGGKRGTYSGRGVKGQKSRSGSGQRFGFRGGNEPVWRLFPKLRGSTKKVDVRRRLFQVHHPKSVSINLNVIDERFNNGEMVTPKILIRKGVIRTGKRGVRILGSGDLKKKLSFEGFAFSASARDKIVKSGSTIDE